MAKRTLRFRLCKVFAISLVVCSIGSQFIHSRLAQAVIPVELTTLGSSATGTASGQFVALSPDKTHLISTFTNKLVFITGEAAWSLIARTLRCRCCDLSGG